MHIKICPTCNCVYQTYFKKQIYCSHICKAVIYKTPEHREKQRQLTLKKKPWLKNIGKKQSPERIAKRVKKLIGHKPYNWTDNPTYNTIHAYLNSKYGKPHKCEICNCSKEKTARFEYALRQGRKHSRNIEDYFQACVSCHRKYDWKLRKTEKCKLCNGKHKCKGYCRHHYYLLFEKKKTF